MPNELPQFKHRMLAIISALLTGLFSFFMTGEISLRLKLSSLGRILAQASGGIGLFVLVLWWWNTPMSPITTSPEVIQQHDTISFEKNRKKPTTRIPDSVSETSDKKPLIFLCHATEDEAAVRSLYEKLKQAGFNPWMDVINILPGQDWDYQIKTAMKNTGFVLICLSKTSILKRGYLNKEIKWALDRQAEMLPGDIFTIPVKLEECDLPDNLSDWQSVDLFEKDGFKRLLESLTHQIAKMGITQGKIKDIFTKEDFVFVPSGSFNMGCISGDNNCFENEKPIEVSIEKGFWIGKHEVTQKQWKEVMNYNQSYFRKGDDYPVEMVSWNDIQVFIEKIRKMTGKKYRLPTEAEWEFACRSRGSYDRFSGGSESDLLGWQESNSNDSTHPVGAKKPNGLGIYDMSGNVWEWCQDVHTDKNQPETVSVDKNTEWRVVRGGGWNNPSFNCRCTFRRGERPYESSYDIGFRLVLEE